MVSAGRVLLAGTETGRHPSMRRGRIALACMLSLAVLAACEEAPVVEEPAVRPVRHMLVRVQSDAERRIYSGTTQAELETDLSFRVGGTLVSRPVKVGNVVTSGDAIASLDDQDFQVQLDEARAGLARAEAERRNAESSYQRTARPLREPERVAQSARFRPGARRVRRSAIPRRGAAGGSGTAAAVLHGTRRATILHGRPDLCRSEPERVTGAGYRSRELRAVCRSRGQRPRYGY